RVLHSPPDVRGTGTWRIHFSPDGALLASTSPAGVRLWDVAAARDLAGLPTGMCSGVVFAPDGSALYTRSAAGLERWPIQPEPAGLAIGPRQHVMALPWTGSTGTLCPAADGKLAANLRDEGTIVLLDPRDPAKAVTLPGHVATMNSLAAS